MIVDRDIEVRCAIDGVNEDATFTFVDTKGFESYLMLDYESLQRFHELAGAAIEALAVDRPEP